MGYEIHRVMVSTVRQYFATTVELWNCKFTYFVINALLRFELNVIKDSPLKRRDILQGNLFMKMKIFEYLVQKLIVANTSLLGFAAVMIFFLLIMYYDDDDDVDDYHDANGSGLGCCCWSYPHSIAHIFSIIKTLDLCQKIFVSCTYNKTTSKKNAHKMQLKMNELRK